MSAEVIESIELRVTLLAAALPAAITFVGVLIGLGVNWLINKHQFRGMVISRSRIEWIQEVRKHAAKYLSHMTEIKIYLERIQQEISRAHEHNQGIEMIPITTLNEYDQPYEVEVPDGSFMKPNNDLNMKKLNIELDKVKETTQLLRLYLPKQDKEGNINEDHEDLQNIMDNIQEIVDNSYENKQDLDTDKFNENLDEFTDEISAYLKQEWDTAKKNKK